MFIYVDIHTFAAGPIVHQSGEGVCHTYRQRIPQGPLHAYMPLLGLSYRQGFLSALFQGNPSWIHQAVPPHRLSNSPRPLWFAGRGHGQFPSSSG